MPTILRVDGYEIMIYTHDHLPSHVHVFARECELVVYLNCSSEYVSLRENDRFRPREIRAILRMVQAHRVQLCRAWKEIHGNL